MLRDAHILHRVDWYEDQNHTKLVSPDVALSGEFDRLWPLTHVGLDYHILHCLYLWRQLHAAVVKHRHVDLDLYSYEHTVHCTSVILDTENYPNLITLIDSGVQYWRNVPLSDGENMAG